MKAATRIAVVNRFFSTVPTDYLGLCQRYVPRPVHDADDYATARQAIEPLLGFEDRLNADQVDYLEAVSSFIEAYDAVRVIWPKGKPQNTSRQRVKGVGP